MEKDTKSCFTSAMQLEGGKNIPQRYILPPLQRPNINNNDFSSSSSSTTIIPVIDLSLLNDPLTRSQTINEIRSACDKLGIFQVINHGMPISVMEDALAISKEFFQLPSEEKMKFASGNVHDPVRYGTSMNHVRDNVFCWRDFLKHYANPISEWSHTWPLNPPGYRQKLGSYAKAVHLLQTQLMRGVIESLAGVKNADYLDDDIKQGSQLMVLNYYPSCPEPDLALGMQAHTDFGTMTILNRTEPGLEFMDVMTGTWHPVSSIQGGLVVLLGDQTEIMSNGKYKSLIHRATVNMERTRLSIASIHSLPIQKKVGPILDLVNSQHPIAYKEGSFGEFLDHISANSLGGTKYIDTLKIPR
uniref:flavanone 3-dioxygenase 3-like n=1 Tax=Erigeron canadensis TaxID=72917 RepID=UPI001CB8C257|nr:flavanone 3-dioxygenase 3-like [Erigeron canadensis]